MLEEYPDTSFIRSVTLAPQCNRQGCETAVPPAKGAGPCFIPSSGRIAEGCWAQKDPGTSKFECCNDR